MSLQPFFQLKKTNFESAPEHAKMALDGNCIYLSNLYFEGTLIVLPHLCSFTQVDVWLFTQVDVLIFVKSIPYGIK